MRRQLSLNESGFVFIIGVVVTTVLQNILAFALQNIGEFGGMSIGTWIAYPVGSIGFFFSAFLFVKLKKCDFLYIARVNTKPRAVSFILIPFIAVCCVVAFYPLTAMFIRLLNVMGYYGSVTAPTDFTPGVFVLSMIIMAIIPAFGEEFFMRGTVYNGVATRGGWFGVAMTALLFMLMHGNPYQTLFQFFFGVVLVLVFIISDSIWPSIILHFLNNFISILVTAYIPQIDNINFGNMWPLYDILISIGGIIVLVFLLYFFYRLSKSGKNGGNNGEYKIVTDDFTITAYAEDKKKSNPIKDAFIFFGSLFTKKGWKNLNSKLFDLSKVDYVGPKPFMQEISFWIALIVVAVEWVIALIVGIIR
ncbi:MAG: CPBP family intramembrane metalloprotease [Clostridia bacterium]|nr:CPBP family intramembrane metalloprotease [Clostridia bacterium]